MEHTHNQFRQATGEHRLCPLNAPRQLGEAYESLQSSERMQSNPDLKAVIELYDNMFLKAEFAEMKNSLDRAYFYSLLYDGIIRVGGTKYEDMRRSDLNVSDPMRLAGKPAAEAVKMIKESLPELYEQLKAKGAATDAEIFKEYTDRIALTDMRWKEEKVPDDDQLLKAPFLHYKAVKARVNVALGKRGILVPGSEARTVLTSDAAQPNLSRDEYLLLLKMAWGDPAAAQQEIERRKEVHKVREWLAGERGKPENKRAQQLYTDFSAVEVGPQEALAGFGIEIGETVRRLYISKLMGAQAPAAAPAVPGAAPQPQEKIVSAATWETNPAEAYAFLANAGLPKTQRNGEFLTALRYWFVQQAGPEPKMKKEDTLAILRLVVQEMVAAEGVVRRTMDEREGLKKKITGAQKLEDMGAGAWEYMKEFSDHPIGSAAMWLVAFMAVKQIIKFVKGDANNFTKYGFWAGTAGLALGLYQQHTSGHAWWEGLWGKAQGWFGKESKLEPKEQTLPNYWAQMLGKEQGKDDLLSPEKERLCLSVLQTQNIKGVLEWYRQKRTGAPGTRVALPFTVDFKLRQQFGANATGKDIEEMMFRSVQRILSNRGKVARQKQLLLNVPNQLSGGDEDIGYQYLMERYVERKYFRAILINSLQMVRVKIGGIDVNWNDPAVAADLLNHPRVIAVPEIQLMLQNAFVHYQEEAREVPTSDWPMWHLFLMESDPEIMRRMNARAGEAAGVVDTLYKNVTELSVQEELYKLQLRWGVPEHMVKSFIEKIDAFGKAAGGGITVGPEKKGETMRIYMPTGIGGLGAARYPLDNVSFQEFITSPPAQLIEKWKQHAFEQKREELKNGADTKDIYEFLNPVRNRETIRFGNPAYKFYPGWSLSFMEYLKKEEKDFDVVLKDDPKLQLTAKFVGAGAARKIEIRARAVAGGYPEQFGIATIAGESYEQVEKRWMKIQATRIEAELETIPAYTAGAYINHVFNYDPVTQKVVWGGFQPGLDSRITASLYDMVKYPTQKLFDRYNNWVIAGKNPAVNPF